MQKILCHESHQNFSWCESNLHLHRCSKRIRLYDTSMGTIVGTYMSSAGVCAFMYCPDSRTGVTSSLVVGPVNGIIWECRWRGKRAERAPIISISPYLLEVSTFLDKETIPSTDQSLSLGVEEVVEEVENNLREPERHLRLRSWKNWDS